MYTFDSGPGMAEVMLMVTPPWGSIGRANLDALVTLADATGNIFAALDPAGVNSVAGLGVPPSPVLLPVTGRYFVSIAGVGGGGSSSNSSSSPGNYSNYGSRGAYTLRVTFQSPAVPPVSAPVPQPPNPLIGQPSPDPPPPLVPKSDPALILQLAAFTVSSSTSRRRGMYTCTASVSVRSGTGNGVRGVAVAGRWDPRAGGALAGFPAAAAGETNSRGTWQVPDSPAFPAFSLGCRFTLTGVSRPGYHVAAGVLQANREIAWLA
jgi:hypothetical protein